MGDDLIEPPCEAIARRHVSLECRAVSIAAPRRYERREGPVVGVEWDSAASVTFGRYSHLSTGHFTAAVGVAGSMITTADYAPGATTVFA